jgi:cell division septum initiation protein DivIVA
MVMTPSRVDTTSPASIAAADFSIHRRGFDRDEVRSLLERLAGEVRRLQEENTRLADELSALRSEGTGLDEGLVADLLGEEAARVLSTAREAATQMKTKAEEGAERLLREAQDEATQLREQATLDAVRMRQEAAADGAAEIEGAKQEGRQMVAEARAVRERMLTDLARRRDVGRSQLARLRADRDRLIAVFEEAGRTADDIVADLRAAAPDPADTSEVETVDEAVAVVAAEAVPHFPPVAPVGPETAPEPDTGDGEPAVAIHLGEEPALTYAGELDTVAEPEAADADQHDSVDDLFAKLRAAGPAEVAAAPLEGQTETAAGDEAEPEPEVLEPDAAYLADRAAALEPIQRSMARLLKRALTNEQNEVLDALRRTKTPDDLGDLDALVGAEADHAERYRSAVTAEVRAAALAGAASVGPERDVPSSEVQQQVLDDVTAEFVVPLRERLAKALEDAGGDAVEAGATLRAGYREWRTQRADEIAGHLVLVAHGRGAYDAVATGTPIRWVVDPEGPLCPDADDNALAGVISAGQPFPTSHCHAPAHPGCRCGIAVPQG